jgi:hypothetical protein
VMGGARGERARAWGDPLLGEIGTFDISCLAKEPLNIPSIMAN